MIPPDISEMSPELVQALAHVGIVVTADVANLHSLYNVYLGCPDACDHCLSAAESFARIINTIVNRVIPQLLTEGIDLPPGVQWTGMN